MATGIHVTTDATQTLTNKTMSGASNTFTSIPSSALPDFILSSTYFSGVGSVGDPLIPIIDTTITDASVVPVTSNAVFDALALKAALISPSFTTPTIGVATATSVNKVTITAPTTSATLTLITGSSLITAGAFAITLTSTGTTGVTLPTSGTLATTTEAKAELISIAMSDLTTAITTGTTKAYFRMPFAGTLTAVRASALTAPTGATIIIDVNETGTTVLSTKLSIDISEKTSTTAASAAVISDSALADDAEITLDFDQVGSTVAGAGVIVHLYITRA